MPLSAAADDDGDAATQRAHVEYPRRFRSRFNEPEKNDDSATAVVEHSSGPHVPHAPASLLLPWTAVVDDASTSSTPSIRTAGDYYDGDSKLPLPIVLHIEGTRSSEGDGRWSHGEELSSWSAGDMKRSCVSGLSARAAVTVVPLSTPAAAVMVRSLSSLSSSPPRTIVTQLATQRTDSIQAVPAHASQPFGGWSRAEATTLRSGTGTFKRHGVSFHRLHLLSSPPKRIKTACGYAPGSYDSTIWRWSKQSLPGTTRNRTSTASTAPKQERFQGSSLKNLSLRDMANILRHFHIERRRALLNCASTLDIVE